MEAPPAAKPPPRYLPFADSTVSRKLKLKKELTSKKQYGRTII
jgi:hypothetical protein